MNSDNKAKILTGARAKVMVNNQWVGLFNNCTWQIRQGKEPAFILGRFSPAEITPTTQEAVSISLNGYRVVDAGPYRVANATLLKALLDEGDFTIDIVDRQTGKVIFRAVGCRVQGWSSGVAARGVSDIRVDVIGMKGEDEFALQESIGGDDESKSASNLTDGT